MTRAMERGITYVIGHKNPDTDSVCSALALAELRKAEGMEGVVAARAGDLNPQTSYILEYLDVQPPRFVSNVYPRARDIMTRNVFSVGEKEPLFKVMDIIRNRNIRYVPVVNGNGRPSGVITLMDLARWQTVQIEAASSAKVLTSARNIVETTGGELVTDFIGDTETSFSVYVGAMKKASFLRVLSGSDPRECAVVVGDRGNIQALSVDIGVGLLVVTGGHRVDASIIEAAKKKRVTVIISPYDSATTALLVRLSTPTYTICNTDFKKVSPDDLVEDIKRTIKKYGERGVIVTGGDGVMQGVVTKSDLLKSSGVRLILVDHNELSQAVDGADEVEILEVVDHHRLGNFHTTSPIRFICEPVGSTSTIVSDLYRRSGRRMPKKTAALLLAGVISDTVALRSPTTTDKDRSTVPWLEEISGLNCKDFSQKIFAATSSLKNRGPEAVINDDFKTYEAKGRRFGIGQVETIGFNEFYEEKERLREELRRTGERLGLSFSALLVTDITYGTSLLLAVGEKEIIDSLEYPRLEEGVYELKDVLSRKKQVAPHILSLFNEIY